MSVEAGTPPAAVTPPAKGTETPVAAGGSAGTGARRDPRPRRRGGRDHGDGPDPRRDRQGGRLDPPGPHPRPGLPRDPEGGPHPRPRAALGRVAGGHAAPGTRSATPSTGRSGCRPRSWTASGAATTASRPRSTRSCPSTGPAPTTAGSWSPGGSATRTSQERVLGTTQPTGGATLVGQQVMPDMIDLLRNRALVLVAGARLFPGLQGVVYFNKKTGAPTVAWMEENPAADAPQSEPAYGYVSLSPKTLIGQVQIPRQLWSCPRSTSRRTCGTTSRSATAWPSTSGRSTGRARTSSRSGSTPRPTCSRTRSAACPTSRTSPPCRPWSRTRTPTSGRSPG